MAGTVVCVSLRRESRCGSVLSALSTADVRIQKTCSRVAHQQGFHVTYVLAAYLLSPLIVGLLFRPGQ